MQKAIDWRPATVRASRDLTHDIRMIEIAPLGEFVAPTPGAPDDVQLCAGDIGRFIRGQVHRRMSHVEWCAHSGKRHLLRDSSNARRAVLVGSQNGVPHGGKNGAGMNRVAPDSISLLRTIQCDALGMVSDSCLARSVSRHGGYSNHPGPGGDVDNAAAEMMLH